MDVDETILLQLLSQTLSQTAQIDYWISPVISVPACLPVGTACLPVGTAREKTIREQHPLPIVVSKYYI
jgi:hypothetical protein